MAAVSPAAPSNRQLGSMMSPAECAKALGASYRFVQAEIARKRLPAIRLSNKLVRIRATDFEAYLSQRSTVKA